MRRAWLLALAMLLATATVASAGTFAKVSGTYTYEYGGGTSTVSLDAVASSPAKGTFSFERDDDVYIRGDVTCVIINDQDAWVIGAVNDTNTDATFFSARVYDSGMRGGAGDEALSFAGPGDPYDCSGPYQWNLTAKWMEPITSGNILIH
jgi:hypothetical protein